MSTAQPDFLCIGAQKAGTTWLHENLSQHPGIWLPPVKELHVLDHAPPTLLKRLLSKSSHHRLAREHFRHVLASGEHDPAVRSLAWHIAYGRRDYAWYDRLFTFAGDLVAGEICPGYARIEESVVARIAARYPRLKIVYLLRDPVDRAWSSVAMHFRKSGDATVTRLDKQDILARLRKPKTFAHCTYRRNIEAWSQHFPENQVYFGFFDRMSENPQGYFSEIVNFLGLPDGFSPRNAARPVNAGKGEQIATDIECDIAELLLPEAEYLHQRFDNAYTARWLAHARQLVRGSAERSLTDG